MDKTLKTLLASTALIAAGSLAHAEAHGGTEIEVTHWWTSGGEAAAVKRLAEQFEANTDNTWIDGAIAGSGGTARPIIISRIIGGDPMAATQLNHGQQAAELIEAGLMTDLTDLAEEEGWRDFVNPTSLLDACTLDGRIYCAPVNIHSAQWLWLSRDAFEQAGLEVPTDWNEFVEVAPQLREAGLQPLAMGQQGWQQSLAFGAIAIGVAGLDAWRAVNVDKDTEVAMGPEYTAVWEAVANAREFARGSSVQDWNQATNLVITDEAGGQIMGDWAQGEFQVAGESVGEDYECLPGLGLNAILDTGGDAFYFPVVEDEAVKAAQLELASTLMSKETQVAFNLAKGSLPVRGDIDMSTANGCMQKGLEILAEGNILPSGDINFSADIQTQIEDLMAEFWAGDMPAAEAQQRYADLVGQAG